MPTLQKGLKITIQIVVFLILEGATLFRAAELIILNFQKGELQRKQVQNYLICIWEPCCHNLVLDSQKLFQQFHLHLVF